MRNVDNEEELVRRRVGLRHRPMNFTIANELMHITSVSVGCVLSKELKQNARHKFTQFSYVNHADEYKVRANDLDDLAYEYDPATNEGRVRNSEYEAFRD